MEGLTNALIARDRLLGELERCEDIRTGQSLWKAAAKFNRKAREERTRLESPGTPLPFAVGGSHSELDVMG